MNHEDGTLCKTHRLRVVLMIVMTVATYGAIAGRLYWLQVIKHEYYAGRAEYQQHRMITLHSQRGEILDRNGHLLAGSHASQTIILDTCKSVMLNTAAATQKPSAELIGELAKLSGLSQDRLAGYFKQGRKYPLGERADEKKLKKFEALEKKLDLPEGLITFEPKSFAELATGDKDAGKGDPQKQMVQRLAEAMNKPADYLQDCFDHPDRHYIYRKAPEEVVQAVNVAQWQMGLPDSLICFEESSKRDYPNGSLASHVIGFTKIDEDGSDNIGADGLELKYNGSLNGDTRKVQMLASGGLRRSALNAISDEAIQATYGNTLVLTIDQQIQSLAEAALGRAVSRYQAISGVAVVMDVATGEILALANCPDYDLNNFRADAAEADRRRNRALTDPREVGSVMKMITSSLMIDGGLLSPDELVNCHDGSAWVGGRVIRDDHPLGVVPFHEAFAESSNIAMASLADARLEPNAYYQGLQRFGVGKTTGIDLPGENSGILRPVARWTAMSKASLAIGYETALTPMQVIAALGTIGDGGVRMKPHVAKEIRNTKGQTIRKFEPEPLGRVVGPETCAAVRELMEGVVLHGTAANKGNVPGYRVGGKTGTTIKRELDKDGHKTYVASFAGLAPIENPKLAIYIYVDAPHGAKYGADVAAPVFREIAFGALTYLMVPPTDKPAYDAYKKSLNPNADTGGALIADAPGTAKGAAAGNGEVMQVDVDESEEGSVDLAEAPAMPRPALPGMEAQAVAGTGPRMPDCSGLTILEAWDVLDKAGIQARTLGSGLAARQTPAAGKRLAAGETAEVVFTNQSEQRAGQESGQKSSGVPVELKLR